jgi:ABC-type Zn uptake system ZnuABC Zn-binding protein ZnuA
VPCDECPRPIAAIHDVDVDLDGHRLVTYETRMRTTLAIIVLLVTGVAHANPVRVCATTPDLGAIVRAIGGADAVVTVLANGTEDPHFLKAKPSFATAIANADLVVVGGLELEVAWLPPLLAGAHNSGVQPGWPGYLDVSQTIVPLEKPDGQVDRSQDVHPQGNPHYLLDPVNGILVAALVRDRLVALQAERTEAFDARFDAFKKRVGTALYGDAVATKYDVEKLDVLAEEGTLDQFLDSQADGPKLGGWLARMKPAGGTKAVDDHPIWAYFTRRFGLDVVAHMEPTPGVQPSAKQLVSLVELMKRDKVRLILASAYYDPRHARLLAGETGAHIATLANQVGALRGTDDYVAMIDYDVREVLSAIGGA